MMISFFLCSSQIVMLCCGMHPPSGEQTNEVNLRARLTIERAKQEQWTWLDLSRRKLKGVLQEIPSEVFDLHQVEHLVLANHNISKVPNRVRELTKLKSLNLVGNPIESLPDIKGLALDWEAYQRCRKTLSKENIKGIRIKFYSGGKGVDSVTGVPLAFELSSLPRLSTLNVVNGDTVCITDVSENFHSGFGCYFQPFKPLLNLVTR